MHLHANFCVEQQQRLETGSVSLNGKRLRQPIASRRGWLVVPRKCCVYLRFYGSTALRLYGFQQVQSNATRRVTKGYKGEGYKDLGPRSVTSLRGIHATVLKNKNLFKSFTHLVSRINRF